MKSGYPYILVTRYIRGTVYFGSGLWTVGYNWKVHYTLFCTCYGRYHLNVCYMVYFDYYNATYTVLVNTKHDMIFSYWVIKANVSNIKSTPQGWIQNFERGRWVSDWKIKKIEWLKIIYICTYSLNENIWLSWKFTAHSSAKFSWLEKKSV